MLGRVGSLLGVPAPLLGRRLLAPGALAGLSFARAQAGGAKATGLAADGITWVEYDADAPRWVGAAQRLLIEGQRTNANRNVRAEGAVLGIIGSGGALPTFWSIQNTPAGVVREVTEVGVEDGMQYVELLLTGTPTVTSNVYIIFDTTTAIVAAPGETWTGHVALRTVGTPSGVRNVSVGIEERTAAGVYILSSGLPVTLTTAFTRFPWTRTLANASTGRTNIFMAIGCTNGVPVSACYRMAWPQMEQAPYASTPILPPVGTPGASTRGADLVSALLSDLGIPASGACALLWAGMIPQNATTAGGEQTLVQLDDLSDNNRIRLFNAAGGGNVQVGRTLAGAGGSALAGSMTAGTAFAAGMTADGAGAARGTLGGSVAGVVSAPTAGLQRMRLGMGASGTLGLFGEVSGLWLAPPMSDAALLAAVNRLPR